MTAVPCGQFQGQTAKEPRTGDGLLDKVLIETVGHGCRLRTETGEPQSCNGCREVTGAFRLKDSQSQFIRLDYTSSFHPTTSPVMSFLVVLGSVGFGG
jgi:hypothetical protein